LVVSGLQYQRVFFVIGFGLQMKVKVFGSCQIEKFVQQFCQFSGNIFSGSESCNSKTPNTASSETSKHTGLLGAVAGDKGEGKSQK